MKTVRNSNLKKSAIASAIAAAMMSPLAFADDQSFSTSTETSITKEKHVAKDVHGQKTNSTTKRVGYNGDVKIDGEMGILATGLSLLDNEQFSVGNDVTNHKTQNEAVVGGEDSGAFQGASGNVGANVAGGSGNQQDNAAALAVSDANWVFGGGSESDSANSATNTGIHSDATAMVDQESAGNSTSNTGVSNDSGLAGNAFDGASGNLGVNAAAGTGNQQKNSLAVAAMSGEAVLTEATVSTLQNSHGNVVTSEAACDCTPSTTSANVAGNAFRGASGNIGVNVASGTGNQQSNSLAISGTDI